MGKFRFWSIAAFLFVAAVVALCLCFFKSTPEPVYHGQPLSYWLAGYDAGNYRYLHPDGPAPPTTDEAGDAVRHIGTNAIPRLLRMLQQPNPKWSELVWRTLSKQNLVKIRYAPGNRDFIAYQAFIALGPQACNAEPQLVALFNPKSSPRLQQAVPAILGSIGPGPVESVPLLLRAINHTNNIVRCNAICALAHVNPDPKVAVPVLTGLLKDPDALARAFAADALGSFGNAAQTAFPALLDAWRKESPPPGARRITLGFGYSLGGEAWFSRTVNPLNADTYYAMLKAMRSVDSEAADKAGVP